MKKRNAKRIQEGDGRDIERESKEGKGKRGRREREKMDTDD